MTRPARPDDSGAWRRQVEQRLDALERGVQAGDTTIDEGLFRVRDDDGNVRVEIGDLTESGAYGVRIFDEDGGVRFWADSDGLHDPWIPLPWVTLPGVDVDLDGDVTIGVDPDWQLVFMADAAIVSHKGCTASFLMSLDEGVIVDVRLSASTFDPATSSGSMIGVSDAIRFDASEFPLGVVQFRWLHGAPLGDTGVQFVLEARRVDVEEDKDVIVFAPTMSLHLCDPSICTSGGVPDDLPFGTVIPA